MLTEQQEQTRNAWDNIATGYDEYVTSTHTRAAHEALMLAGLQPGMSFLDVAAGSGALSIPAARIGAKVLAIDLSPVMLQRLQTRARQAGLSLETRVMDGHALELEDNTFDVAGSQFGVMLFPDMPRGIREMTRVTKPGGRVLLTVFSSPFRVEFITFFVEAVQTVAPSFTGPLSDPPPLPFQLQDVETLRAHMTRSGLKDVVVETTLEELEFTSGLQLWNWLVNSNPIVKHLLNELQLTEEQISTVKDALEKKIRERAGGADRAAVLTNALNIGIGIK